MALLGDQASKVLSGINLGGLLTGVTLFFILILFTIVISIVAYFIIMYKKYNQNIVIWEEIGGKLCPNRKDKAMIVKVAPTGETLLFLRKNKVYRSGYGNKVGKNTYHFAAGKDGYWYGITFQGLDNAMSEVKILPVDTSIRLLHSGIYKNIEQIFGEKKNWLKENLGLIVGITTIVIVLVFQWLVFDKYVNLMNTANGAISASRDVVEATQQLLSSLDTIKSGGSGIVPA